MPGCFLIRFVHPLLNCTVMVTNCSHAHKLLVMLMHTLGVFMNSWISSWAKSVYKLTDYQHTGNENKYDLISECVLNTHQSNYGLMLRSIFKRSKNNKTEPVNHFHMSARTRVLIHTEYALDLLRKSHQSFEALVDCIASIQLLSCFRYLGDPEGSKRCVVFAYSSLHSLLFCVHNLFFRTLKSLLSLASAMYVPLKSHCCFSFITLIPYSTEGGA